MGKTSAAVKNRYAAKKYDRIIVQVKKGRKDELKQYAAMRGVSLNKFINNAIDEALDDEYCQKLYAEYQANPDKGEPVEITEFARSLGISL